MKAKSFEIDKETNKIKVNLDFETNDIFEIKIRKENNKLIFYFDINSSRGIVIEDNNIKVVPVLDKIKIEFENEIDKDFAIYLSRLTNKIYDFETLVITYDILKAHNISFQFDVERIKNLLMKDRNDYKKVLTLYNILKENNCLDSILGVILDLLKSYLLNALYRTKNEILEFTKDLLQNDEKLFVETVKRLIMTDLRDDYYIKQELLNWVETPSKASYFSNYLILMKQIIDNNLIDEFKDEFERFKKFIEHYNDAWGNRIVDIATKRIKRKIYAEESITLLRILNKFDAILLKYLI